MAKFLAFLRFDKLRFDRMLLSQFSLVLVAFFLMVFIGNYYGSRIVKRNITSYGDEVVSVSAEAINAYLNEFGTSLGNIAFSVERLHRQGADFERKLEELMEWDHFLRTQQKSDSSFLGIVGVLHDTFVSCDGWIAPDHLVPQSRPWYIGAYQNNGEVYYSDPYVNMKSGEFGLSVSILLFDDDKKPFGVIAIDLSTDNIKTYIEDMYFMGSGWGVLVDNQRRFIVHPDNDYIGRRLETVNEGKGGFIELSGLLAVGQDLSAFPFKAYNNVPCVAFYKRLSNGWSLGYILPRDAFNMDARSMLLVMIAAGIVSMALLCTVLAYMYAAMRRSDEASRVKSSFLASMSHEIRTPMNSIIGMSEFLQHESLNTRQMGYVNDINSSAHALLTLINDILDLSKIESGKMALTPVNYDFPVFLDNVVSMIKYMAKKKGLDFKYEVSGEIPKYLYGDDIRLRQVLTNLCGNAVKFTERGYVRMRVVVNGETLRFEIEDTGRGISRHDMPKIFNSFEQADVKENRKIVGAGLGLAISKTYVEMMDGKIMVESEYGKGSTFTVEIPKVEGSAEGVKYEEDILKEQELRAPSANVLVVDDNEFNLRAIEALLSLVDIKARTAHSGREAIELVQREDFDIMFMDHMMPDMDGIETTARIRKMGGKYSRLVIIALTANAVQGAESMFLSNGFDGYVSKPIEMRELEKVLVEWLPREKVQMVVKANAEGETGHENTPIKKVKVEVGAEVQRELQSIFLKGNRQKYEEITKALEANDIKTAQILAHSLKANAGQLGKTVLQQAASDVEAGITDGKNMIGTKQLAALKPALDAVIAEFSLPVDDNSRPAEEVGAESGERLDSEAALKLIEELEPLLKKGRSECRDYIKNLRRISGNENLIQQLIQQIEDFDFGQALVTLGELKKC